MPSIAEATGAQKGRRRRRIAAGIGLLLAGATFVGVGAAGAANAAVRNGAVIGGLAVLAGLVLLADRVELGEREHSVAAVGAAVGLAGLFAFWSLSGGTDASFAVTVGAATLYSFGVAVMLGAVLAAGSGQPSDRPTADAVEWERGERSGGPVGASTDGGPGDEERAYPAEDD